MDAEQRLALALSHAARADVQEQVQEQVQDQVQDQVQEQVQPQAHERVQDQDQVQEKVQQQVQDAASGDVVRVDGVYYFACPHCGATIAVVDIACGIFRCGLLKEGKGETPVPPHADKATCDRLVQQNKVWGCARPFKFDGHRATACGGHELEIQREAGWDSEEISYEESDSTTDGESDSASDDDTSDDDSSDDASGTGYHKRQGATDGREGGALVGFLSFPGFRLFASAFDDQGQRGAVLARCERTQANALIVFPQLDPLT